MCGIFGFLSKRLPEGTVIDAALKALAHRGPDDTGTATSTAGGLTLGYAFTRLAILDLSPAGHQPMRGPNGELLILNGEIHNHRELRAPLEAAGVAFHGTSDTETLLHLLIRDGVRALDHIFGMYAFAFWDPATATLLLGRDRFGKKPLYWVEHPTLGLVFASEVRTLLATGAAPRELDRDALGLWLARGSCQDPTTPVRGVRSLRPGHVMVVSAAGREERPYWTPTIGAAPPDWRDQLEALLDDAVRQRLLSDRPIGVFLSGGVDSSAIAAVAARHARDAVQAFTLTFDEAAFDEGERAHAMAARLGLRHHASHLTAAEALSHLEDALAAQDLPSHDGFNTWFVARAARAAGLVVALAGTGGDEVFAGYRHFRSFGPMMRFGAIARVLPGAVRKRLRAGVHPALPTRLRKVAELAGTGGDAAAVYGVVREMFAPVVAARLLGRAAPDAREPEPRALGAAPPDAQLTLLELGGYLVDTQLRDVDTMSMAHALEVRTPLLDHRLVQAVLALPPAARAPSRGINKRLLVDLAGLPREAFREKKHGFVLPWDAWLRGPLAPWVDRHLAPDRVAELGVLDATAVQAIVRSFRRRRGVDASRVLSLVALAAWCERHEVRAARAAT